MKKHIVYFSPGALICSFSNLMFPVGMTPHWTADSHSSSSVIIVCGQSLSVVILSREPFLVATIFHDSSLVTIVSCHSSLVAILSRESFVVVTAFHSSSLVTFVSPHSSSVGNGDHLSASVTIVSQGSWKETNNERTLSVTMAPRTKIISFNIFKLSYSYTTCKCIWIIVVIAIDYFACPFCPLNHVGVGGWMSGSGFHVLISGDDAGKSLRWRA